VAIMLANMLIQYVDRVAILTAQHAYSSGLDERIKIVTYCPFEKNPIKFMLSLRTIVRTMRSYTDILSTGVWGVVEGLIVRLFRLPECKQIYIRSCGMMMPYYLKKSRIKKWLARMVYVNYNLRHSHVIACSDNEKEQLYNLIGYSTKISVISNCSPAEIVNSRLHEELSNQRLIAPIILYLGRISPVKGVHLLIEAFKTVLSSLPNAHLRIVGPASDETYKNVILSLLSEIPSENFSFEPGAYGSEKVDIFRTASVVVLPTYAEGIPNILLEALGAGLPIVTTRHANLDPCLVSQCGSMVDNDCLSVANGILSILQQPYLYMIKSNNAYNAAVTEFNQAKIMDEYLSALDVNV
jgi:glycosyltransferase involved in cell wall biosynthesis